MATEATAMETERKKIPRLLAAAGC
jgi:hypothetical protein